MPSDGTEQEVARRKGAHTRMLKSARRYVVFYAWIFATLCTVEVYTSRLDGDENRSAHGHVEFVRVAVNERGVHSLTHVYSVMIVSIDMGEAYNIRELDNPSTSTSNTQGRNATGVIRLVCGTDIFESHSLLTPVYNASFFALPQTLVSEDAASRYLPTFLASIDKSTQSLSKISFVSPNGEDTILRAFLVTKAEGSRREHFSRFSSSAFSRESNLKLCRLRVLRPNEQSMMHKKILETKSGIDKYGEYTLDIENDGEDDALFENRDISNELSKVWRKRIRARYFESLVTKSKQGHCVRHPKVSPAFLQMMTKSRARGILDGILPIDSIVSALANPIAGAFANRMEKSAADISAAVLQTEVASGLEEGIANMIKETLLVSLSETIVDTTSETIAAGLQQRVAYYLTSSLSRVLTRAIDRRIAERVPEEIGYRAADRTVLLLMRGLAQTLSRSVSQSLVPALIHTMSHSPLQDYYCYYCYHHGVYCSYCHYAPLQLYYAQYYVSYYAPYYGEWSSNYFKRTLDLSFLHHKSSVIDA